MRYAVQKVLIAGGTGFLGYHAALLFRRMGIPVSSFALPGELDLQGWYPKDIHVEFTDLFASSENELTQRFSGLGADTLVYALGPDDRTIPIAPAYSFFHSRLVDQSEKICRAGKRAGMKRCVVLNSYFSAFDREMNGILSRTHPYIRARREQEDRLMDLGSSDFAVMILELPFIFGTMPHRQPLWKGHFLDHFSSKRAILFPKGGGTAAIEVSGVAEAIVAAAFNGENGRCYPIGKLNLTYETLINTMMEALEDPRRFQGISPRLAALGGWWIDRGFRIKGKESGLNHARLMTQILAQSFYINPEITETALGYSEWGFRGGKDVLSSIAQTIRSCYPERFPICGTPQ
jgi:nucleoside-diphosphate-sugar epimerase